LDPGLSSLLQANLGAFLLGNTAPDVQVISGQKRHTTHFFSVPIPPDGQLPWVQMLQEYPGVNHAAGLHPSEAAFIAGYLCHLQADWLWVLDIFQPVFGPNQNWETFSKRLYLHNALRAYLDDKVIPALPPEVVINLQPTQPHKWLPFVENAFLIEWRDFLCDQLQSGERIQTVDVFASRHGMDPAAFHSMINSEEAMERDVFVHISRQQLRDYRERLLVQNLDLLEDYLSGSKLLGNRITNIKHQNDRSGT
jgi:hypothetical protein